MMSAVLKKILFNIHWFLGITVGLFAVIMAVSGAAIEFDQDIVYWSNGRPLDVKPVAGARLSPNQILERAQTANPNDNVERLIFPGNPHEGVVFDLTATHVSEGDQFVNPYTGEVKRFKYVRKGLAKFTQYMEGVHRSLTFRVPGEGRKTLYPMPKWAMFYTSLTVLILSLTGLYLRWPKSKRLDWRSWFRINFKLKGYAFLWSLHAVVGTFVLIAFVFMSHSGLLNEIKINRYMQFAADMTGATPARFMNFDPVKARATANTSRYDLDKLWLSFEHEVPRYAQATIDLKESTPDTLKIQYLLTKQRTIKGGHSPALNSQINEIVLDAHTGAVIFHDKFADRPLGYQVVARNFDFHSGAVFGLPGRILFLFACLMMPVFYVTGWMMYLKRRKQERAAKALKAGSAGELENNLPHAAKWLIAFASQTGNAEQIAWQTAKAFHAAGEPVSVTPLSKLQRSDLEAASNALFIVSTHGEGDPPDNALTFVRDRMAPLPLPRLHYGVLALGDSGYAHFCGFGRRLDQWLSDQGAQSLFDRVEVDALNPEAIKAWETALRVHVGDAEIAGLQAAPYHEWTIAAQDHLNPGSAGNPVFHIALQPPAGVEPDWQAGDLVEVLASADPERPREYSIASIPSDGRLDLLIRQERKTDGTLGVCSGWLTSDLAVGEAVKLRLRAHPNFRLEDNLERPIILIGNGTGLAGLRALLKARVAAGVGRNWLIFGERNAHCDAHHREELEGWRDGGLLPRLDMIFSRDVASADPVVTQVVGGDLLVLESRPAARRYVQDQLRHCADEVRRWVDDGAAIYVCGSLEGMAGGVDAALTEILGLPQLDALRDAGRYRRDVY